MDAATPTDLGSNEEDSNEIDSFKLFLENTHPSVEKRVDNFWKPDGGVRRTASPEIRIYCQVCNGDRTFRSTSDIGASGNSNYINTNLLFICGDCHKQSKFYALHIEYGRSGSATIFKYGEKPPYGVPVANKVLRLFGRDGTLFLKGRQCENLGYGVAAFAYYRRVVENHKNDIFDEIIKVCRTVHAPDKVINELEQAKKEIAFTRSVEGIKSALPQGLLINGHNPLLALHGALSVGLHDGTDEECLAAAQAVRLVLTDLVEKMATLKQDNRELNDAVQLLLKKKN